MKEYCIVKITFKNKDEAKKTAEILLQSKLIACAQISIIDSFYYWNKKIENEQEFLLSVKTKNICYNNIEKIIIENNSYDLPQIITIPIVSGYKPYFEWIDSCLDLIKPNA